MTDILPIFAKKTSAFGALIIVASLLTACGGHGEQQTASVTTQPDVKTQAQLFTVHKQELPVYALFPASVITADQISISSRVMGYVRSVDVHEGQSVKAGTTLLTIDSTDVTGAINQARAQVNKAYAALADAKNNYERYRALYKESAVPKQVFEQMQTAYKVAQSNFAAAKAALNQAQSQLTYVKIKAPFSGTITSRMIDAGQLATPGTPLMTLQGSGHKQVEVQLTGQAFATLKLGEPVIVRYTDFDGKQHQFKGPVERMVDATDPITHTHTVKIGVPENVDVRSGNYVVVEIAVAHEMGMLVPPDAIQNRGGIRGVFVLDDHNRAWFRMVRLGHVIDGKQVILSGLVPGERIVLQSSHRLQNGIIVTNAPATNEKSAS